MCAASAASGSAAAEPASAGEAASGAARPAAAKAPTRAEAAAHGRTGPPGGPGRAGPVGPAEDKGPVDIGRGRHAGQQVAPPVAAVAPAVGGAHHDHHQEDQQKQPHLPDHSEHKVILRLRVIDKVAPGLRRDHMVRWWMMPLLSSRRCRRVLMWDIVLLIWLVLMR